MMNPVVLDSKNPTAVYSVPTEPTLNELRGIRYMTAAGGGEGAGGDDPKEDDAETEASDAKPEEKPNEDDKSKTGNDKGGEDAEDEPEFEGEFDEARAKKAILAARTSERAMKARAIAAETEVAELKKSLGKFEAEAATKKKTDLFTQYGVDEDDQDLFDKVEEDTWEKLAQKLGTVQVEKAPKKPNAPKSGLERRTDNSAKTVETSKKRLQNRGRV